MALGAECSLCGILHEQGPTIGEENRHLFHSGFATGAYWDDRSQSKLLQKSLSAVSDSTARPSRGRFFAGKITASRKRKPQSRGFLAFSEEC